jgi:hypothetical protein
MYRSHVSYRQGNYYLTKDNGYSLCFQKLVDFVRKVLAFHQNVMCIQIPLNESLLCTERKVVPAIKEKWLCCNRNIVIQQDSTSTHIDEDDTAFVEVAQTSVWNIKLETRSASESRQI